MTVFLSVAPTARAIGPSLLIDWRRSFGTKSMPSAEHAASRNARVEGMSRSGHSCRPSRATASASSVTGLAWLSIEPWPAVPCAVSRSQAMPFSAVCTR